MFYDDEEITIIQAKSGRLLRGLRIVRPVLRGIDLILQAYRYSPMVKIRLKMQD